jgi:hypothetical protein
MQPGGPKRKALVQSISSRHRGGERQPTNAKTSLETPNKENKKTGQLQCPEPCGKPLRRPVAKHTAVTQLSTPMALYQVWMHQFPGREPPWRHTKQFRHPRTIRARFESPLAIEGAAFVGMACSAGLIALRRDNDRDRAVGGIKLSGRGVV